MATGRPRSFDRDAALEAAMVAFWEHGYDTTSLSDLVEAMGITPPSLYAAFGDKQRLFVEAVERYGAADGGYMARALAEEPTATDAIGRMLLDAAAAFTRRGRPRGCMTISAAANCSPRSADVEHALRAMRRESERMIAARIRAGVASGELPPDADSDALARYVGAIIQGLSQQARDGATRRQLEAVARTAMAAWPVGT